MTGGLLPIIFRGLFFCLSKVQIASTQEVCRSHSAIPRHSPLLSGHAPGCKQPLRLGLIEPAKPGHDSCIYECASRRYSETVTVKYR